MPSIEEALAQQRTPLGGALAAGVESLSRQQTVTFTLYKRLVLPIDGFVFWVKADLLSRSALFGSSPFDASQFNRTSKVLVPAPYIVAKGSLHRATDQRQDEDETYAVNSLVFTAEEPIQDFDSVAPDTVYIATFEGVRFAFSSRRSFYVQAELHHYVGQAIYADMETQIVDSLVGFDGRNVVVSNSLPLWLGLNSYFPPYQGGFANPVLKLYPSYLLPQNITPPFGAVHIDPTTTEALGAAPIITPNSSHWQLVRERVRITTWGMRNFDVMDFVDCVNQYTIDTRRFGLMNSPVPKDEKREQRELGIIAQKKTIEYEISYQQVAARDIARQLILEAIPTFIF